MRRRELEPTRILPTQLTSSSGLTMMREQIIAITDTEKEALYIAGNKSKSKEAKARIEHFTEGRNPTANILWLDLSELACIPQD